MVSDGRRALILASFQFEFTTEIEWNIALAHCGQKVCRGEERALFPLVVDIWNGAMQGPATNPTALDAVGNKVRQRHAHVAPRYSDESVLSTPSESFVFWLLG